MKSNTWFFAKLNDLPEGGSRFKYYPLVKFESAASTCTINLVVNHLGKNEKGGRFTYLCEIIMFKTKIRVKGHICGSRNSALLSILERVLKFIPKNNSIEVFTNIDSYEEWNREVNRLEGQLQGIIKEYPIYTLRTIRESWGLQIKKSKKKVKHVKPHLFKNKDFVIKIPVKIPEGFHNRALIELDAKHTEVLTNTNNSTIV